MSQNTSCEAARFPEAQGEAQTRDIISLRNWRHWGLKAVFPTEWRRSPAPGSQRALGTVGGSPVLPDPHTCPPGCSLADSPAFWTLGKAVAQTPTLFPDIPLLPAEQFLLLCLVVPTGISHQRMLETVRTLGFKYTYFKMKALEGPLGGGVVMKSGQVCLRAACPLVVPGPVPSHHQEEIAVLPCQVSMAVGSLFPRAFVFY